MTINIADVAVLIVSYNTEDLLRNCLRSVVEQRGSLGQQIIVVDNGSADGSVAMVRTEFPEVELIDAKQNLGFARGVNLAATRADAEYLLLLNPDTVVLDRALERLVQFARSQPGHGLYGGRALKTDGSLELSSCWALPTIWSTTCFALGLSTAFRHTQWFDPEAMAHWRRDTVREVGIVTGCLLLAPRDVWDELGGFDERYFMYGEDADLALRAKAAGYRPIICPDACIIHEVGKASATKAGKLLLLFKGKATLFRDHFDGWRRSLLLFQLLVGVGLRAQLARARSRSRRSDADPWGTVWRDRHDWIKGYPGLRPSHRELGHGMAANLKPRAAKEAGRP
ncbi:glycosyltransferase family 2 protein [Rhodopseudomonas sp. B29]|uniref:glycosyltransferase family 2 protein n=1 Tax=Rhodopseudomonas sp. B29 TaxID=95607 RepID=UPI0003B35200|nr:glycosyltransferase family 2 protein [Rhodopseudomonas sp. B29]